MGMATGRELHVDQHLTEIAMGYRPSGMIADQIAPIINVDKERNTFVQYNQAEAFQVPDTLRSRGTAAKKITASVGSDNYLVKNYALAYELPIEDRANMDAAFKANLDIGATFRVLDGLGLDWDKRVCAKISVSAGVGSAFVPNSAWNAGNTGNTNAGDPIAAIYAAREQQNSLTGGYGPNSILFGWKAWNWFRRNKFSRDFINGVNNGGSHITRDQARSALEMERLLVASAFRSTNNEAQSATYSNNFPADAVLLYYAPMRATVQEPSYMYSFRWTAPELPSPLVVERHPYDTKNKMDLIEAGYWQDEKITASTLGHLILGVGSAQSNGI